MHGRNQAAGRAHDVDPMAQHRDAQAVAEVRVAYRLELPESVVQRVEGLRIDRETLRILEDEKRRGVPVNAPGDALLAEDRAHAVPDRPGGRLGARADVLALDNR